MELYHVLNRGVDKRMIYKEDDDRVRFVHDLYEFNDKRPANNTAYSAYQKEKGDNKNNDFVSRYSEREMLVDIHGWCLMGNHYHLLLSERRGGGVTQFIRKLNIGYA